MKTLLLLFASLASAQTQLQLTAPSPSPVPSGGGAVIGTRGGATLYYWVVARYPVGTSVATGPFVVTNTVGVPNLTASNYVSLSWVGVAGATGYDVLRNTGPAFPSPCSDCALTLNTSNTAYNDQGTAGSSYPAGTSPAPLATLSFFLNNRDLPQPFVTLNIQAGGNSYPGAWLEYVNSAPSGACSSPYYPVQIVIGTPNMYSCQGGTWQTAGGSSSGLVPTSRLINTTAPLTGGGALSADLTLACPTCTALSGLTTGNIPKAGSATTLVDSGIPATTVVQGAATLTTALIIPTISSPGSLVPSTTKLNGGILYPTADSTTALQINKADGTTNVVTVDSTNRRVGFGGTTAPTRTIDIGSGNYINATTGGMINNDNTSIGFLFPANNSVAVSSFAAISLKTYNGSVYETAVTVTGSGAKASVGIGPSNTSPAGTLSILDATPTTGSTATWIGHDGSGTYTSTHLSAVSTKLSIVAGTAQSGDLLNVLNSSGGVLARIQSSGEWQGPDSAATYIKAATSQNLNLYAPQTVILGGTTSGTLVIGSNVDASFSRVAAATLALGSGAAGSVAGSLQLTHLIGKGVAPTITAGGGTSPSIAGSDTAFRVTVGTGGVATSVTVTFGTAFATAPACMANDETTSLLTKAVGSTTTVIISAATPWGAGDSITGVCVGY